MDKILEKLKSIDVDKRLAEISNEIKATKDPKKHDKLISEMKILTNLKDSGMSPADAFIKKMIPVIPSQFRSPIELPTGSINLPDVNVLMRNIGMAKDAYNNIHEHLDENALKGIKKQIYSHVEKLMSLDHPEDGLKNYWDMISPADAPPKSGFFQRHVTRKRVNMSGRSVISPNPDLDIDKIEIPYEMGYDMFKPFIVKEMRERGFSNKEIDKMIERGDDNIKKVLDKLGKDRPVVINRAPSIANGSITAHWPIFVNKRNINIPNLTAPAQKGDFDGDCCICLINIVLSSKYKWLMFFLKEIVCQLKKVKIFTNISSLCIIKERI